MPRKLFDIDVDEMTLCASAANRKKFAIRKREDSMKFIELLKSFLAEGDEDDVKLTKEETAKVDALADEAVEELTEAIETLEKYEDDMPPALLEAMKTITKYASFTYPDIEEEEEDDDDVKKAGAKLSKTTRAQISKILAFLKESPKAIAMLKELIGEKVDKVKDGGDDDDDDENLSAETQAKLDKLAELEKTQKEDEKKEAREKLRNELKEEIKKDILGDEYVPPEEEEDEEDEEARKKLRARKLKKKKVAKKKSIDGQEDDDADDEDDEEDHYPSLPMPTKT